MPFQATLSAKGGRTMIIKCKMCGGDIVFEPPRDKG